MTASRLAPHPEPATHCRGAVETVRGIESGQLRPADVAQACLDRIAEREPVLRAWAWLDPEAVHETVRRLPADGKGLPLYGVPIGIKDIIDTADMPTAYGSALYAGHRPAQDAEVVARLRRAGAIVMGKTVTTEFAYTHPGPTTNPWNPVHTPGGSSSGSAAAVAAGMVPLALGSQTGGSTIRPSAYCGIVGFKPSHGAIPLEGVRPLSPTMDTLGIHARDVADAALLFGVLAPQAASAVQEQSRIALYPGPHADEADADSHAALRFAARQAEACGFELSPIDLPPEHFGRLSEANRTIMAWEGARIAQDDYDRGAVRLGASTRQLIETGRRLDEASYRQALALALDCARRFDEAMQPFDLLLTFSAPGRAPLAAEGTGPSTFNRAWTTLGVPCITLPLYRAPGQLPLGVQLVARRGADRLLLRLAARLETALASPPPIPTPSDSTSF